MTDNCAESTVVDAARPDGVRVEVDVPTCLVDTDGRSRSTRPALTVEQAIRVATDPRWGRAGVRLMSDDAEFAEFAHAYAARLRTTAFMICHDWHLAQDLTQTTLTKLFLSWRRAAQADNVLAYAQKVLLRTYLDHRRRRSSSESTPGVLDEPVYRENPELRLTMLQALGCLPARDRAIVILRYFEDYSVEQVADVLDLPVNVVKSQTRRSLVKLRELLAADELALFA